MFTQTESSPIKSARVPVGFLVLFEQRTSKEVYSDGEHACFARDYVEKEVASSDTEYVGAPD